MTQAASDLEHATHVAPDEHGYVAHVSKDWEIWGPNGGYLATIALRTAGMVAEIKRPASFYCHFLSSPAFDAVELKVNVLRRGRRAESLSVEMTQAGKPVLHAMVKTAVEAPGYSHQHPNAPQAPPPETLKTYEELYPDRGRPPFSFWENVERRPLDQGAHLVERDTRAVDRDARPVDQDAHPVERDTRAVERDTRPVDQDTRAVDQDANPVDKSTGDESREPVIREWARFRPTACFDDPFLDAARALILLDTYGFPAAYRHHRSWEYLAPNLDTGVWFHHFSPDAEWLLIDSECAIAANGLMGVGGRVWDTTGKLLASGSAQLCCIANGTLTASKQG